MIRNAQIDHYPVATGKDTQSGNAGKKPIRELTVMQMRRVADATIGHAGYPAPPRARV